MFKHSTILLCLMLLVSAMQAQEPPFSCPTATNKGTDFWFMYLYNMNINSGSWTSHRSLIVAGDQSANIHVEGPGGLIENWNMTGGSYNDLHEYGTNTLTVATPFDGGYHITSTQPLFAYTRNYIESTLDVATLLPTSSLGTRYIVQDYPSQQYGGEVGFVATEDNTVLTMTVPCDIHGTSISAGTTLTPTLMQGQAYLLLGVGSLAGMEVTSNGKPFAMFQGAWNPSVPENSGGRDHMYEQALPIDYWGTDFIIKTSTSQSVASIRITASEDSCVVICNGNSLGILSSGQTYTYPCNGSTIYTISTSKAAMVVLYLGSYTVSGHNGDPASVIIPPLDHGICESRFVLHNTTNLSNHFVHIVCDTSYSDSLSLDGVHPSTSSSTLVGGYRVYSLSVAAGGHSLMNSEGPFVAYAMGTGIYESYAFPLGFRLEPTEPEADSICPNETTMGRDFWVSFIINGGDQRPEEVKLIATGDTACTVTVENNLGVGWSQTVALPAGGSASITLPNTPAIPWAYYIGLHTGFHITSTANINLTAIYTQLASTGATSILPTRALGTRYIVLDYPADPSRTSGPGTTSDRTSGSGATVTILTTEPNTIVQYTPPCPIYGSSIPAGTPNSHTFASAGQTSTLMTNDPNASLSGMEITSNKPIAVFQGNQVTGVPYNSPSGDLMYEQSWPVDLWGHTYALIPTKGRSVGDRIRVVADSACLLSLSGGSGYTPMTDHGVIELDLPANQPRILTSTKPVSVGLCSKGSDWNAEPGDASLLMVPPFERGICHGRFTTFQTQRINIWYVAIATDAPESMTLDGNSIASQFQPIDTTGYSYARISVSAGDHTLDNSDGIFTAWTYGVGNVECYYYSIGMDLDSISKPDVPEPPTLQIHDTMDYLDTVCQNAPYSGYGFTVGSNETIYSGTLERWRIDTVGDTIRHNHLMLTVLPISNSDTAAFLIIGDTLFFLGDTLTQAGTYLYTLTAANGCDSLLILYLNWEEIDLTLSADGLCPGDTATITASGTHTAWWSASPPDPDIEAQQGQTTITVSPRQTTIYTLCAYAEGPPLASITIGVEPPPVLCVDVARSFIDFDHPVVNFTDCSDGAVSSTWSFSDNITITNTRARRQFRYPLPDSVIVTLTSCNRYHCCIDTTFNIFTYIRSVWFPNVFTPDAADNNRFGCITSVNVVEFELHIYNRWGLLVYRTDDPTAKWDGTRNGQPLPQGTYVYYWRVRDDSDYHQSGTGTVTLIR